LDDLQPLFLILASSQIVELSIEKIFSVVGVGIQRKLIMNHLIRNFFNVIVFFAVYTEVINPSSGDFT
jgi:hypothetical protein